MMQEVVVTSSNETDEAKTLLQQSGYIVTTACGAGYKLLCVALGVVKCYALTKDTTYAWDTCAAHAMLVSLGGTMCHCSSASAADPLTYRPKCSGGIRAHCNVNGIIASRDPQTVDRVHSLLRRLDHCSWWRLHCKHCGHLLHYSMVRWYIMVAGWQTSGPIDLVQYRCRFCPIRYLFWFKFSPTRPRISFNFYKLVQTNKFRPPVCSPTLT